MEQGAAPRQNMYNQHRQKKFFLKQTGAAWAKESTLLLLFRQGRGRSYFCCIALLGLEYIRISGQEEFGTLLQ